MFKPLPSHAAAYWGPYNIYIHFLGGGEFEFSRGDLPLFSRSNVCMSSTSGLNMSSPSSASFSYWKLEIRAWNIFQDFQNVRFTLNREKWEMFEFYIVSEKGLESIYHICGKSKNYISPVQTQCMWCKGSNIKLLVYTGFWKRRSSFILCFGGERSCGESKMI